MAVASALSQSVSEQAHTFAGQLIQASDPDYEEARRVHNGLVDKRPALIARCRSVADVADAVQLARKLNLEVAVRGGGHNVAGRATVDGGLVIDLSPMKGIHVDAKRRTARALGGVTWAEFNWETQLHGLATTGGVVSSTGMSVVRVFGTPIHEALVVRGVPVRSYYAESELSRPQAQRAFALLRLLVGRQDLVALRWLIGVDGSKWNAAGYRRVRAHCENTGELPWDVLTRLENGALGLPYTQGIVAAFRALRENVDELDALPNVAAVVDRLFPDGQAPTRDLRQLALVALEEGAADDRGSLLAELVKAISQPEVPSEVEDVRIMSLHKSKGLSAPVTIIAGCVEGLLPREPDRDLPAVQRAQEMEEQRRLFYVGITRVKAQPNAGKPGTLILTYSQRMRRRDVLAAGIEPAWQNYGTAIMHASRFIGELGNAAPRPVAG